MVVKNKKTRWLFPTNTNNLRMVIAQGLLTSPEGFSKYYQDLLHDYPGYLPLFNNQVPSDSLEKSVSEAEHLVPCLLEFDLSNLTGRVSALVSGKIIEVDLDSNFLTLENLDQLFIPLPLPIGCIFKIIFKSKIDADGFKKDVGIRSNVILNKIKLSSTKADSKFFETTDSDLLITPHDNQFDKVGGSTIKPSYSATYAYGGILSLLFYHAKNGAFSHDYFESFSQGMIPQANDLKEQAIPQFFYEYFNGDVDSSRPENKILDGIVASCVESDDFKNSVINFLRNGDWDEKVGKRSKELANTLDDYVSNNSRSVSDWFNSAKSDIEKILLMLFTREDSESLLDFHNSKIKFIERDYLLYSLFFGIRDGFIKTPAFIRKYNTLQVYISNQMAVYTHKKMDSEIGFKEVNPPKTVWQLVDRKLSKENTKQLSLESCVQTIMPKADFENIKGMSVYSGYYEPTYKIITEEYFNKISVLKITDAIYNNLK